MRGPLIFVTTVVVGGALLLGLSRLAAPDAARSQPEPVPAPPPAVVADASLPPMTVYQSPTCGCCSEWIEHVRAAGFRVEVVDTDDLTAIKVAMGVPGWLGACHTAEIDGVLVEGHVPAAYIASFLAERPAGVRGIAVPGMPIGSPGMEVPGRAAEPYDVIAFRADGATAVFRSHRQAGG